MINNQDKKLAYSVKEAVKATSLGRSTIFKYISSGKLKTTRLGGRTVILADSLHALIEGED